ncbi:MAG: HDOD domain-containing protein [Desulfobacteraceae bacterium]|jgi:putative nucleotidyltransferase with HDIG domain|nr:HDOD domain-containing protein [Desulfobacteraceae bacterium]
MTIPGGNRQATNDIPDKILQKVSTFPSMPKAAIKLRALISKEDVSIAEIERILRQDPGLAANVLRLANSAFFGIPTKVATLKQAVMLLGVQRFSKIAVGACMNKTMDTAVEGYGLSPGKLWLHSIAVSTTAEALAKNRKLAAANDFFTPALLHDLGKLVLGTFVKTEQPKINRLVAAGVPFVIAEREVLNTDHAEIGALILSKWSFPDDLVNAVRWHHYPEGLENSNLQPEIVYLSNLLCHSKGDGGPDEEQLNMPYSSVLNRLRIDPDQYGVLAEKARNWMKKLSETLTFD